MYSASSCSLLSYSKQEERMEEYTTYLDSITRSLSLSFSLFLSLFIIVFVLVYSDWAENKMQKVI